MHIACLHTAENNADIFRALAAPGITLSHTVRADLLSDAEAAGGLTDAIAERGAIALVHIAADADAVLLTCSTLGPAAERAASRIHCPVLRVDRALADAAVTRGGRIHVLYAVATTDEPTKALFEAAAAGRPVTLTYAQVPGAWDRFKAGDHAGYHAVVAEAADAAYANGVRTVALAQASMAGAAELTTRGKPLTSPAAGLQVAVAAGRWQQGS